MHWRLLPLLLLLDTMASPVLAGTITTIGGTGAASFSGDGGPATSASFNKPTHVAIDASGNVYVADEWNTRVRRIDRTTGTIMTVAGGGAGGDGGPALNASLAGPYGLELDSAGNLYLAELCRIRRVEASGTTFTTIMTVAGNGTCSSSGEGIPAITAAVNVGQDIAFDSAGNLYFTEIGTDRVRRIEASGTTFTTIMTVAGSGVGGYDGDGIPAKSAMLNEPYGITLDATGNVLIADSGNHRIRKVLASGTTFGAITTIAGDGTPSYNGDGILAVAAQLKSPADVTIDHSGNILVADKNQRVRRIDVDSGLITTVAGTGAKGYNLDGVEATLAWLNELEGVDIAPDGSLIIADQFNERIRQVVPSACSPPVTLRARNPEPLYVNGGEQQMWRLSFSNSGVNTVYNLIVTTQAGSFDYRTYVRPSLSVTLTGGAALTASQWATSLNGPWTKGEPPNGTGTPLYLRWAVSYLKNGMSGAISFRTETNVGPERLLETYATAAVACDAGGFDRGALSYSATATGKRIEPPLAWLKVPDGSSGLDEDVNGVAADSSGNIYTAGREDRSSSGQAFNWLIVKYDSNGVLLWSRSYTSSGNLNDWASDVTVDAGGNAIVVGSERRLAWAVEDQRNWLIRKYDGSGNLLWSRTYQGPGNGADDACSLAVDGSGGIYVGGGETRYDIGQARNWVIRKYDSSGGLGWHVTYNNPLNEYDEFAALTTDLSGNVIAVGREREGPTNDWYDWRIRKYDSLGNLIWSRTFNGAANLQDTPHDVATDANGNVVVVGREAANDMYGTWRMIKYDYDGNLIWSRSDGSPLSGGDYAGKVAIDGEMNIVVPGYEIRADMGQGLNWVIRKYDNAGNLIGAVSHDGIISGDDAGYGAVCLPGSQDVVMGGYENVRDEGRNIAVARYATTGFTSPAAPAFLTVVVEDAEITLGWDPAMGGTRAVVRYEIYRATSPGFAPSLNRKLADVAGPTVTGYVDSSALPGVRYYYRIRAVDSLGAESVNSVEVWARLPYPCDLVWETKADLPTPRWLTGVGEVDGELYVIGGNDGPDLAAVERYSPSANTWTTRASMGVSRASPGVAVVDGKIYVIGGRNAAVSQTAVEVYDPVADLWTTKASMPTAREGMAMAVVGGKIYVIGGNTWGVGLATVVEVYDPVGNSWATKAPMPTARTCPGSGALEGKIYVVGGILSYPSTTTLVEAYDVLSNTWSQAKPMNVSRGDLGACVVEGRILAVGGTDSTVQPVSAVEEYDPGSDQWTIRNDLPTARGGVGVGYAGDSVFAFGGSTAKTRVEGGRYDGGRFSARALLSPPTVSIGQWFAVELSATNTGSGPIDAATARGAVGPGGSLVSLESGPSPAGPLSLDVGDTVNFAWTYSASGSGVAVFTLTAAGRVCWSASHMVDSGTSVTVQVPARLAAAMHVLSSSVCTGSSFVVTMTVTNEGQATCLSLASGPVAVSGGGNAAKLAGPYPAMPMTLAGGASVTFSWTYQGTVAGLVSFTTTVNGTDGNAGWAVATGPVSAAPLEILSAGTLTACGVLSPSLMSTGQWFTATLTVTNTGGADVTAVSPRAVVQPGGGLATVQSGPSPLGPLTLAPGGAVTFSWTYSASGSGVVTLTMTAEGTSCSGARLGWATVSATVQTAPQLRGRLTGFPGTVSVGQDFLVTLTVTNGGQAAATGLGTAPFHVSGGGGAALIAGPTPAIPVGLAGGSAVTFTWTCQGTAEGVVVLTTTVTGTDVNSGYPVSLGPVASNGVVVQAPASLKASLAVMPAQVCPGSKALLALTVTNNGTGRADGVKALSMYQDGPGAMSYVAGPQLAMPVSLNGGASVTFTWTYQGTAVGGDTFSTTITGVDANTGWPVTTGPVSSGGVSVQSAAVLAVAAAGPASVMVGDWVTVTLTVTNTGGQAAAGINPTMAISPGAGLVVLKAGPVPAGPVTVIPGAAQTFGWTYSVAGAGSIGFAPSASGLTCATAGVTGTATALMQAQAPAQLVVDLLELNPAGVTLGSPVTARLVLRNAGDVTLRVTGISPVIGSGTTGGLGAPGPSAPPLPFLLSGGASQTVTWQHGTGAPCGTVYVTAMSAGVEIMTGRSLAAGPVASNVIGLAGVPAGIVFTPAVPQAVGGERVLLTAYVTDSCGIGVPGQTVEFAVSSGGGSLSVAMGVTDVTGRVPVELTLGLDPGTNVVRAQVAWTLLSATALVQSLANPLALDSPGGALSSNVFSPATGEIVLARISPRTSDPILVHVYTPSGRLVRKLNSQHFRSIGGGQILVEWDGRTDDEFVVTRGVYLIRITGGGLSPVILKVVVR